MPSRERALTLTPTEARAGDTLRLLVRPVTSGVTCLCNHPLGNHREAGGGPVFGACSNFVPWSPQPYGGVGTVLWGRETWLPLERGHWCNDSLPAAAVINEKTGARNGAAYR